MQQIVNRSETRRNKEHVVMILEFTWDIYSVIRKDYFPLKEKHLCMYNLLHLSKCLQYFPVVQLWISCDCHDINSDYFPKQH
jgi:hypothetical protein